MLIVVSPAKKLDFETSAPTKEFSRLIFLKKSQLLINDLKKCKPTEISKLIKEIDNIEIKPSMIQPTKEIKSLGTYRVKIYLHSEVDAEITLNVESSESIQ